MKKILYIILITFILALLIAPSALAAANGNFVFDETGILTDEQIAALNAKSAALLAKRGCAVYIWIVDLVPEKDARTIDALEAYTDRFYFGNNLGYGADKNGIVLLLEIGDVPGERDYLFYTNGACTSVFNNSNRESLLDDEIVPLFKSAFSNGNFYKVASTFLDQVDSKWTSIVVSRLLFKLAVIILVPFFIALIVCSTWKRKMKTAVLARTADNYIPANGFQLTERTDQFLYRTTTRTRIETDSSSGGGGSSSSSSGRSSGGKV